MCSAFQVVSLVIIPKIKSQAPLIVKQRLKFVIFSQYVPRLTRLYPLYMEVKRTSGILTQTAWAGAAYNLFLYMLASHVSLTLVGDFNYLTLITCKDFMITNIFDKFSRLLEPFGICLPLTERVHAGKSTVKVLIIVNVRIFTVLKATVKTLQVYMRTAVI